ncbi:cytochrome P450 [Coprinopsis cinerea okayama7|uniref:Cytochrome P450 n=1 Tax=Coprinopsis cinerea (strain Okayama-7 / 130 / ATCC MYA-4618 / FGSC 9003) TaxID=240176 RepID=A8P4P4_COPC7|nr:cytochrome P450 [Coprinopsis cinerea okayama7\|eukprot:XP_001838781.2 cytochrome P450 [Coprinopsis cinerea okayama7\
MAATLHSHSFLVLLPGFALLFIAVVIKRRKYSLLPPGPQGSLLFGVARKLPKSEPWKTYANWARLYDSDVISFQVYNRRVVVLNSADSIYNLLEKRQEIYSERPMSWMYNVICDRGNAIFNIDSSDTRHKQYRKLILSGLGPRGTREYATLIQSQAQRLASNLVSTPEAFVAHVQTNAVSVILRMAFGYTVQEDDPFIKVSEEASKISGWATQPGRWLVDYLPILRFIPSWLPGAEWKRQGLMWRQRLRHLADIPHEWAKQQMESGVYEESFTSRLLRAKGGALSPEEDDVVKWCASGLYAGAGDTTVSAIISFILLMALYPEVQWKAQNEVSGAVGKHRSSITAADSEEHGPPSSREHHPDQTPSFDISLSEIHQMPYLNAILKELLRFAPVGNLALPHRVLQDDEYEGRLIPEDSTIIANVWAVLHDPNTYPDPFRFNPERFTTESLTPPQPDPRRWAFGFGRRSCPGSYFAETTILYAMYNILATCSISIPKEGPMPTVEFTTGITSHIKPFPITVERLNTI